MTKQSPGRKERRAAEKAVVTPIRPAPEAIAPEATAPEATPEPEPPPAIEKRTAEDPFPPGSEVKLERSEYEVLDVLDATINRTVRQLFAEELRLFAAPASTFLQNIWALKVRQQGILVPLQETHARALIDVMAKRGVKWSSEWSWDDIQHVAKRAKPAEPPKAGS